MRGTLIAEYEGTEFEVEYEYRPARPGRLHGRPEDCYEDEPAEIEVHKPKDFRSVVQTEYPESVWNEFEPLYKEEYGTYEKFLAREISRLEELIYAKIETEALEAISEAKVERRLEYEV